MAIIREYQSQFGAKTADLGRRATPEDFGDASGLANLGAGIYRAGVDIHNIEAQREVSDVHVQMAKANADWSEEVRKRQNEAKPGDMGYAAKLRDDMSSYFGKFSDNFKTREGQEAFKRSAADLTARFGVHAIGFQSHLAGEYAKTQFRDLNEELGRSVFNDPTQYELAKKKSFDAINDPNSMYANLDQATKAELLRKAHNDIDIATSKGLAVNAPEFLLGKVAPQQLAKFKPVLAAVKNTGQTVDSVLPSLIKTESGGRHLDANGELIKSSSGAEGITQILPSTGQNPGFGVKPLQNRSEAEYIRFAKDYLGALQNYYKGDMTKAIAAYNAGAGTVDSAVAASKNPKNSEGGDWTNYLPEETKNYIMKVGSGVTVESTPVDSQTNKQEKIGIAAFDNLSWKEQYDVIHMAEQTMRMNKTASHQAAIEAEKAKKDAQESVMNNYFDRLLEGKLSVNDIKNDRVLSFQQREHMIRAINTHIGAKDNTDANVFVSTFQGIHNGSITSEDQINSLMGNGLSITDVQKLRGELIGKHQPLGEIRSKFFKMAESQISKSSILSKDPEGDAQFYRWTQFAETVIAEKTKEGIPMTKLFNPNDKEYIGWTINQFVRTPKQIVQDNANMLRGKMPQPEQGQVSAPKKSLHDIFAGKK